MTLAPTRAEVSAPTDAAGAVVAHRFMRERLATGDPKADGIAQIIAGVQRAIGIPVSLFTAIFALARTVGWISQWKEMIEDPGQKIGRPRQLYTGSPKRDYVPLTVRGK